MTRIATSARGATPDDGVDPRFGRAKGFVVFDTATGVWSYIANDAACDLPQGAGLAAAESLARAGIGVVLTGTVGPKAAQALAAARIVAHEGRFGGGVRQAVADHLAVLEHGGE